MVRYAWIGLLLVGCASGGRAGEPDERVETFVGLYEHGFEVEAFRPCGGGGAWWVANADALHARHQELGVGPYRPIFAVVRGRTGPEGTFGHLGAYVRELTVVEVVEARRDAPAGCAPATLRPATR